MSILAGCSRQADTGEFLTVDFNQGEVLRYEFVSSRHIDVTWNPAPGSGKKAPPKPEAYYELVKMVMSYEPLEVRPFGYTTIRAKCESVEVTRWRRQQQSTADALKDLQGRTFILEVGPNGRIKDHSEIEKEAYFAGANAFRSRSRGGKIKDPDAVSDFIATQWFLWDAISSIENPQNGVEPGQQWQSQLSIPLPMVFKQARDVTYTLEQIKETEQGKTAVIKSNYSTAPTIEGDWPIPYPDGSFRMSGTFGFLRRYRVLSLQGEGEEFFDMTKGQAQSYHQKYNIQMEASLPISVSAKLQINIEQHLMMKLLKDQN
jgi:hypothetical protein